MIRYEWNENWSTVEIYDDEILLAEIPDIFSESAAALAAQKWYDKQRIRD
jgi:hypothetical protein